MEKETIVKLHSQFEEIARTWPESGTEFWPARDLQDALGYARWENFRKVID
jgi:DNA-damage-inducible protein D